MVIREEEQREGGFLAQESWSAQGVTEESFISGVKGKMRIMEILDEMYI